MFNVIVACDSGNGIGKDNKLPWRLKKDMQFFKDMTTCPRIGQVMENYGIIGNDEHPEMDKPSENAMNAVIMGRKTWESIPEKHRPLKDRLNIVLSRSGFPSTLGVPQPHDVMTSLRQALERLSSPENQLKIKNIFVVGGAEIYKEAFAHPKCMNMFITRIESHFECDTFLPVYWEGDFKLMETSQTHEEDGTKYRFTWLQKVL